MRYETETAPPSCALFLAMSVAALYMMTAMVNWDSTISALREKMHDDIVLAAQARGLERAAEGPKGAFMFTNCTGGDYDDVRRDVKSVLFNIDWYSVVLQRLVFAELMTELEAVRAVENYLSQPLTKEYYTTHYSYYGYPPWKVASNVFARRGDLLIEARFLEDTTLLDSQLTLNAGAPRYSRGSYDVTSGMML